MKYLCLVYLEDAKLHAVPDSECLAASERLRNEGRVVAAEALHPVHTATTLRLRDGNLTMTDGPFAETKEQLAGFYLVDCKDLDEAIEWAAKIPGSEVGSVEVRPIMDYEVRDAERRQATARA